MKLQIKLNQLNNHFLNLIKSKNKKEALKGYDQVGFKEYEEYKEDPTKFFELDEEIDSLILEKEITIPLT
jgi:hypothetical protein